MNRSDQPEQKDRILLILDLDETLIYGAEQRVNRDPDFAFGGYFIYQRPGLIRFLETVNKHFELAIWSSAEDAYVKGIADRIKPAGLSFRFVWGRSRCSMVRDLETYSYIFEKRLKKLKKKGYSLNRILIVDDTPSKTRQNYGNVVYIPAFEGDSSDRVLEEIAVYLESIKDTANVRALEKRGWRNV